MKVVLSIAKQPTLPSNCSSNITYGKRDVLDRQRWVPLNYASVQVKFSFFMSLVIVPLQCKAFNKPSVERCQGVEALHLLYSFGSSGFLDNFNLFKINIHSI